MRPANKHSRRRQPLIAAAARSAALADAAALANLDIRTGHHLAGIETDPGGPLAALSGALPERLPWPRASTLVLALTGTLTVEPAATVWPTTKRRRPTRAAREKTPADNRPGEMTSK
jgi:hypothetical protein